MLTEAEVVAKAVAKFRARKPVGRPSVAEETMIVVHLAVQRMRGVLTQGKVIEATRRLFTKWHNTYADCTAPSLNILRAYVKAYLLYRRDGPPALARFPKQFPPHIRRGLEGIHAGFHVEALLGFAGTVPKGPTMIGPRAIRAAAVTARIRTLPTLPR